MMFKIDAFTPEQMLSVEAVRQPEDARDLFRGRFPEDREAFLAIYLNSRHQPLFQPYVISVGSLNASLVHPREVFKPAIYHSAAAIIVAHNHPSGSTKPSGDDLDLTRRLDEGGNLLGIAILDHMIMDELNGGHCSIREYGWPTSTE